MYRDIIKMEEQTTKKGKASEARGEQYDFDALRISHHLVYNTDLKHVKMDATNYYLENPYPISKPNLPFETNYFDELLRKKREFLIRIEPIRNDFRKNRNKIPVVVAKSANCGIFPRYLIDMCDNSNFEDPDSYFPDNYGYNWYYTGGALDYITLNDTDYIVTPARTNQLLVTKPNELEFNCYLDTNFSKDDPVYGIKSDVISNDSVLFTLRQKHRISLIQSDSIYENDLSSCLQFEIHSADVPYWDATLDKNLSSLFTLKANGFREIVDLTSGKKINENYYFTTYDSFGQIICVNNHTLIFNNSNEIVMTDNRLSQNKVRICLKNDFCDDICSFMYNDDDTIYIATKHHLIKYDFRNIKPIENYVHMLESEPYLISSVKVGATDVVCLANQKSKVLIECGDSKVSLPLQLPSIRDTYELMQLQEKAHIYRDLEQRLSSAAIGMKLRKSKEGVMTLFSLNAIGDIFQQKLSTERLHQQSEKILSAWIDALPKVKTNVVATELAEMSDARFTLNRKLNKNKLAKLTGTNKTTLKTDGRLYGEDNVLGSLLEKIWLDDEDEEEANTCVFQADETTQKVLAWLHAQKDL